MLGINCQAMEQMLKFEGIVTNSLLLLSSQLQCHLGSVCRGWIKQQCSVWWMELCQWCEGVLRCGSCSRAMYGHPPPPFTHPPPPRLTLTALAGWKQIDATASNCSLWWEIIRNMARSHPSIPPISDNFYACHTNGPIHHGLNKRDIVFTPDRFCVRQQDKPSFSLIILCWFMRKIIAWWLKSINW